MYVRNLALNQLADEDVGTLANRLRSAEDLFPFRMAPPAAPDATADNPLCEIWTRATSGLEDDSVTFNKCERVLLVHDTSSPIASRAANENKISCDWQERVSQNSYAVIIREICSQLVGQGRCEHVVCATSQKRLASAMYHVSAFRPRVCHRSHVCVFAWPWLNVGELPRFYNQLQHLAALSLRSQVFRDTTATQRVKIASPDFVASIFRGYYEPATATFSADVAFINRSQIQRTIVGATFIFHERGNKTQYAMYGTGIFGDVNHVQVEPGKTVIAHYTQKINLKHFNAIALTPSGKTKGEAEAGLQIVSLNPEGIQQLKSIYFMSLNVDEGICQPGMFQGQKVSLNTAGDVFIH
jgi:hypothetical protein